MPVSATPPEPVPPAPGAAPGRPGPRCGICGAPCRPPFRAPAAELAPDLDMRPGEPARSTLPQWLATCGRCGAVAPDLASLAPDQAGTVALDAYRAAARPLRWAMLCPADRRGEALLEAAWAADDAGEDATDLRLQAAEAWPKDGGVGAELRRLDILRRAGGFQAAEACAVRLASLSDLDEVSRAVIDYQINRIAARDTGRHLLSAALHPPARRPHVSYGGAPSARVGHSRGLRGLLARLSGG